MISNEISRIILQIIQFLQISKKSRNDGKIFWNFISSASNVNWFRRIENEMLREFNINLVLKVRIGFLRD